MNLQSNYCPTTSSIRKRRRCLITLILAAFLASLLAWPALAASPDPGPTLGTNLTWLRPNTGEWPFVDAFKTSLPWIAVERYGCFGCPAAGDLDLDPNGWVESLDTTNVGNGGQAAVALLFLQAVDMYPEGLYTVLYDGGGTTLFALCQRSRLSVVGTLRCPRAPGPATLRFTEVSSADPIHRRGAVPLV